MQHHVLSIGYPEAEYETEKETWQEYGIVFDFVDTVQEAAKKLPYENYVCITIRADQITNEELTALREAHPTPVLVLPPSYSAAQRYACVHFSAAQYLHAAGQGPFAGANSFNDIQHYLDLPTQERKPLTIITVKDLCFCLEYRSVEVRGQDIELTAKEFDILALLIMNQRRVFTYEMILDLVWHEKYDYYSRKAIVNHISNLRKKLKVAPDIPEYIKSVHSIGYKFEVK